MKKDLISILFVLSPFLLEGIDENESISVNPKIAVPDRGQSTHKNLNEEVSRYAVKIIDGYAWIESLGQFGAVMIDYGPYYYSTNLEGWFYTVEDILLPQNSSNLWIYIHK